MNRSNYIDDKTNQIDWTRLYAAQNNFENRMLKQTPMASSVVQDLDIGIRNNVVTVLGGEEASPSLPQTTRFAQANVTNDSYVKHYTEPLPEEYNRLCPILYEEAHKLALRNLTDQARSLTREEQDTDALRATLAQAQHDLTVLTRLRDEIEVVGAKETAQRAEGEVVVLVQRGKQQPSLFASMHPQARTAPVTVLARERARAGALRAETGDVAVVRAMPPTFAPPPPASGLTMPYGGGSARNSMAGSRPVSRLPDEYTSGSPTKQSPFETPRGSSPPHAGYSRGHARANSETASFYNTGMVNFSGTGLSGTGPVGYSGTMNGMAGNRNGISAGLNRGYDASSRTGILNEVGVRVVQSASARPTVDRQGLETVSVVSPPSSDLTATYKDLFNATAPNIAANNNVTIVAVGPDKGLDTVYHIPMGASRQAFTGNQRPRAASNQPPAKTLGDADHVLRAARSELAEALVWTMPVPDTRVHSSAVFEVHGDVTDSQLDDEMEQTTSPDFSANDGSDERGGTGNAINSSSSGFEGDKSSKYISRRDGRDFNDNMNLQSGNASGWALAGARELFKPVSTVRKQLEAQGQVRMSDSTLSVSRKEHDRDTLSSASTQVLTTALRPQRTDCRTLLSPVVTGGYSPRKGVFNHQPNPKFLDLSDHQKTLR